MFINVILLNVKEKCCTRNVCSYSIKLLATKNYKNKTIAWKHCFMGIMVTYDYFSTNLLTKTLLFAITTYINVLCEY